MIKLLILDDDELMLEGITRNIAWEAHGFQVVGTAANGLEGQDQVNLLKPDIVLTDIKMPFLDGLKLAEQLAVSHPYVKVVFLTGYDDFELVKQALQVKAVEYVMKYEDNDVILAAVLKARNELEKERKMSYKADKHHDLIVNKFLSDLLAGVGGEDFIEYEAKLLGVSFASRSFAVAVLSPGNYERISKSVSDVELLLFSMKNVCDELIRLENLAVYCVNYNNKINLLFHLADEQSTAAYIDEVLVRFIEAIRTYLKIAMKMAVGQVYEGYKQIPLSYQEALVALDMKEMFKLSDVLRYDSMKHHDSSHATLLKRIVDYIHTNYQNERLSLQDIADEVHLAPSYISTLFKKYRDINFSEYLINLRMAKAKELLVNTDLKTYEISEHIGYANSQYFSVLFKKSSGSSPTEYRQLFGKSTN